MGKLQAMKMACLNGIVDEIVLFYMIMHIFVQMDAVRVIFNGIELASVIAASSKINAVLATIADTIPTNSIVNSTPNTNAGWTTVNDVIHHKIITPFT
jgi:hypothetical protein